MNPAPFAYPQTAQLDEALGLPSQLAATVTAFRGGCSSTPSSSADPARQTRSTSPRVAGLDAVELASALPGDFGRFSGWMTVPIDTSSEKEFLQCCSIRQ
ncbi:MAG: hypothetical protein WB592_00905 [Acidimicrobiales bacterium]|jgi:hypothetical protein